MITKFIDYGVYTVTIRHRDGGSFFAIVRARNHSEAARMCSARLRLIWSECHAASH